MNASCMSLGNLCLDRIAPETVNYYLFRIKYLYSPPKFH